MDTSSKRRQRSANLLRPSPAFLALFSRYLRWYVPRSVHAVRLAHRERFPRPGSAASERLIVTLNHPSWWDPLISGLLSRYLLPGYFHYAPMEASALAHYRFMRRLGLFAVDNSVPLLAPIQFLRAGMHILDAPSSVLWVTPEGQFTDVRRRPIAWKSGLAALIARARPCTVVPLALEYTFWDERLPEALALVGEPMLFRGSETPDKIERSADAYRARLLSGTAAAQDELEALALTRSGQCFETVLRGSTGGGGVYSLWKRTHARLTGHPSIPEQAPEPDREHLAEQGGVSNA
jgi:1-acyl-sn-glycerol-3-phosphate acyltransferase